MMINDCLLSLKDMSFVYSLEGSAEGFLMKTLTLRF